MKKLYVNDILKYAQVNEEVELLGWVKSKYDNGGILFLNIVDSTGCLQVLLKKDAVPLDVFLDIKKIPIESSIKIQGVVVPPLKGASKEIEAKRIEIIGLASLQVSPSPRTNFKIFDAKYTDLVLRKRHLFLRNEKVMAIMKIRSNFMRIIHDFFLEQGFIEINAPILTQIPLYEDNTAFNLDYFGTKVFLTQCVAFYLESAMHAFEKVYSIGPSFRAEHSGGKRHLAEYWHLKAEIAFSNLEDIISFTENLMSYIANHIIETNQRELEILDVTIDVDKLKAPYPRINYDEAVNVLNTKGLEFEWGKSLGADEEKFLSQEFESPFWVTGLPIALAPFPYVINPSDSRVAMVADLLAPEGYGELLGVAEKICDSEELLRRMGEKGMDSQIERYQWYLELREYGCVPHSGFGMGIERVIRWLLKLDHVRNAIPFPRLFGRSPYP